jgi:hypothetical protein
MRRLDWRAAGALLIFTAAALVLGSDFGAQQRAFAQSAPTQMPTTPAAPMPSGIATPPPPIPTATPVPSPPTATPQASGKGGRGGARATAAPQATATPTSPAYSSLDGSWEVQVQKYDATTYSSFTLKQDGNAVSGTWNVDGKQLPMSGSYDGRAFHFTATAPTGNLDLSGYIENSTDMVGIVDNGKGDHPNQNPLAFTAEHRGRKPPPLPLHPGGRPPG